MGNDGRGVVTVLTTEVVVARGEVVDGAIVLGRKVVGGAVLNERGAVVATSVVDASAAFLVRGAGEGGVMALFLVRGLIVVVVGSAAFFVRGGGDDTVVGLAGTA